MAKLATHFPRRLLHVGLFVEVVGATVQPVLVSIDMELFEVPELIERMMLQVVVLNLIILRGLRLILEPPLVGHPRGLVVPEDLAAWGRGAAGQEHGGSVT